MNIIERKQQHWGSIRDKFKNYINGDYHIQVDGLDDYADYYNVLVRINQNKDIVIMGQCDCDQPEVYAMVLAIKSLDIECPITDYYALDQITSTMIDLDLSYVYAVLNQFKYCKKDLDVLQRRVAYRMLVEPNYVGDNKETLYNIVGHVNMIRNLI